MKDVRTGDRDLLPLLFQAILGMEKAIIPMRMLDPNGNVVQAWNGVAAIAEAYAATCEDVGEEAMTR